MIAMADTVSVTTRYPVALRDRLDKLAEVTERSRAWHLIKALEAYLEEAEQDVNDILEGIRAAEAGDVVPGEEVGRMIRDLVAANKVA
jgi:predicted transcriptional regulator